MRNRPEGAEPRRQGGRSVGYWIDAANLSDDERSVVHVCSGTPPLPSRNLLLRSLGSDLDLIKHQLFPETLHAGQVLNEPGEEIEQVRFLTGGLASSFVVFETGDHVECLLVGRNGAVGAMAALGFTTALARNVCLFDGHAWSIRICQLQAAMAGSPRLRATMTRCCELQMSYAIRVGACNTLHRAEQRIARWLTAAADLLGQTEIRLPQDAFAGILRLQRSSISPVLGRFQTDGLISISRGRLQILDYAGLRRRGCECQSALEHALRAA
ncbi:MAG: Crp/Fnr family transcriptional regulator [Phenylobacterium sp.]|nr:Crp/Fnr family transcriptional regulator [Phenylobacterium sp.]